MHRNKREGNASSCNDLGTNTEGHFYSCFFFSFPNFFNICVLLV